MKLLRDALLVVLALALPACSGGGDSDPIAPQNPDVTGQWDYLAMDITGEIGADLSVQCDLVGGIDLDQQGGTFSGTLNGAAFTCGVPDATQETVLVNKPFPIYDGQVIGADVGFRYDAPFLHPVLLILAEDELGAPVLSAIGTFVNIGTVSGNSMSGTVFVQLEIVLIGTRNFSTILEGTYSATR